MIFLCFSGLMEFSKVKTSGKAPSPRRYVAEQAYVSSCWGLMLKHSNWIKHIRITDRKYWPKFCIHIWIWTAFFFFWWNSCACIVFNIYLTNKHNKNRFDSFWTICWGIYKCLRVDCATVWLHLHLCAPAGTAALCSRIPSSWSTVATMGTMLSVTLSSLILVRKSFQLTASQWKISKW